MSPTLPGPDQTVQELILTLILNLTHQQIAAKGSIIEASTAQLAVQGVYNKQLNEALNTKKKARKKQIMHSWLGLLESCKCGQRINLWLRWPVKRQDKHPKCFTIGHR